jgi:hypothetical protein
LWRGLFFRAWLLPGSGHDLLHGGKNLRGVERAVRISHNLLMADDAMPIDDDVRALGQASESACGSSIITP